MILARLAVDLGTSHTVAVVRRDGQPVRALLFDGSPLLPSGVAVGVDGALHTGRDAERVAQVEPDRFEPHPKRRIDEGAVLLGERVIPVADLLAAILRRVAMEARTAGIPPGGPIVLTCPADWGRPRRDVLGEAARLAGLGDVALVAEPVAAAAYCMAVVGQRLSIGQALAVFDFGGGTLDVTVVRRDPDQLRVLATGGLDDLGGLDIDAAVVGHLGHLVELRDPALWRRIQAPADAAQARERRAFWAEARAAKEMLSRASSAPVHVSGRPDALHLTRDELERIAGPLVARAVDETRRVVERAGLGPGLLAGVLLVGGSSRMPLVASRLHARFGVAPTMPEQPELPVAHGGLLLAERDAPVGVPVPPPHGAMPGPPVSPVPAPVPPPWVPTPPRKRRGRRIAVVATATAVVLVALVATAANVIRNAIDGLGAAGSAIDGITAAGSGSAGKLTLVHDIAVGAGGRAVAADAQTAYYATSGTGTTKVVALPAGGGKERWTATVGFGAARLTMAAVNGLLILGGEQSTLERDARAVLDTRTGKVLWTGLWYERSDLAIVGADALVESRGDPPSVLRVDLRTGRTRWSVRGPDDLILNDERMAKAARRWPAGAPAAGAPVGLPSGDGFAESLVTGTDVVLLDEDNGRGKVIDGTTGKVRRSGALPLDFEYWDVYEGMIVGKRNDSGGTTVILGYRLSDLRQAWQYPLVAGSSVAAVRPCGPKRICVVATPPSASDDVVYALDTTKGTEAWKRPTSGLIDVGWFVVGGNLVFGEDSFGSIGEPAVIDPANKDVRRFGQSTVAAMGSAGSRLIVQQVGIDGGEAVFRVAVTDPVADKTTGTADCGTEPPADAALAGDLLAVATAGAEPRVRIYKRGV